MTDLEKAKQLVEKLEKENKEKLEKLEKENKEKETKIETKQDESKKDEVNEKVLKIIEASKPKEGENNELNINLKKENEILKNKLIEKDKLLEQLGSIITNGHQTGSKQKDLEKEPEVQSDDDYIKNIVTSIK